MREIPQTIHNAINILQKTFDGTEVVLISEELIHNNPCEFYPNGRWGVNIEIMGISSFLGLESMAEEIVFNPYGYLIAQEFVHKVITEAYPNIKNN